MLMMKDLPLREASVIFSGRKRMTTRKPMITIYISWMKMVLYYTDIPIWGAKPCVGVCRKMVIPGFVRSIGRLHITMAMWKAG